MMCEVVSNEILLHAEVFTVIVFVVVCEGRRLQLLSMIWWEMEGFFYGSRKLGGHSREMILRRNGVQRRIVGCQKSMLRNFAGIVAHTNSGS